MNSHNFLQRTIALALLTLALLACSPFQAAPTQLPTTTPTSTLTGIVHPPGTLTGVEKVDAVIDAVLTGDIDAMRELVHYTITGCTTALGLGGPPKCESNKVDGALVFLEEEGTLVEVFPFIGSEGGYVQRESIDGVLQFEVEGLYAVYRVPDDAYQEEYWPAGRYGVVFSQERDDSAVTVLVDDSGIVRISFSLDRSPAMVIERDAGELLLPPVIETD